MYIYVYIVTALLIHFQASLEANLYLMEIPAILADIWGFKSREKACF